MDQLLSFEGDKRFLNFDDLNRDLQPENVALPEDIDTVLQKLEGSSITVADSDERLIEQIAGLVPDDDDSNGEVDEVELDLSAGSDDKANDPVRLYLREMGVCHFSRVKAKSLKRRESNAANLKLTKLFPDHPLPFLSF